LPETVRERSPDKALNDRAVLGIACPRMAVFRPLKPNGSALLITPGGGYSGVVVDKEGYGLGPLFADRGITVFVLFYRLPHEGWAAGPDVALSDAQRAMRLIRARAPDYDIDPARVRTMGKPVAAWPDRFWHGPEPRISSSPDREIPHRGNRYCREMFLLR
jgi:acetyl esterase/lipase